MEQQLFDWTGWDQQDTSAFIFYDVTLKVDIGEHKVGTKFSSAFVDFGQAGTLEFYRDSETDPNQVDVVSTHKLLLQVVS